MIGLEKPWNVDTAVQWRRSPEQRLCRIGLVFRLGARRIKDAVGRRRKLAWCGRGGNSGQREIQSRRQVAVLH